MKISYNWLQQYCDLETSPDKVADMLTGCGLEVEDQELYQTVKGGLKGVVIGEVLTCEKHPNSDHLSLTTVNAGHGEPLKIVCGAPNVAAGQKVAVATLGTTLYFQDKELTLQRTRIRGEVSEGMICAEDELGLGTSHAGILVLDPGAPVGMPASEYLNIKEDTSYTIGLTPNRVDAASHIGAARDLVAVANNFGGIHPSGERKKLRLPDVSSFRPDHDRLHVEVIIEDPEACPRYSGLTLSGIRVAESPEWLKHRLLSVGLRPINNIVDITNYVLMETGHPLHAFDCDMITSHQVIIRKCPAGTRFITLDQIERSLTENDLMICNNGEPMCIAGVFGGIKSGVTAETVNVFLESAYFDPGHVRRTSRHHGLQTDASFRFERGADPQITVYALKRAALLIKEIAGGEISSEIVDVYPATIAPVTLDLSYASLDRLTGKVIARDTVRNILLDLGFGITGENQKGLTLQVPAYKVDVTREADVIEEILRIYGYNNVEIPDEIRSSLAYTREPDQDKVRNIVSEYLSANGFLEMMNNSLTRSGYYENNPEYPAEKLVRMMNPISRDLDAMRQTLLYGALESVIYNHNRKAPDLKLYEFGKIYQLGHTAGDPLTGYHEETHLALIMTGLFRNENWNSDSKPVDFFDLRGYLEGIFRRISISMKDWVIRPSTGSLFLDGLEYLSGSSVVAQAGRLSPSILKKFDCRTAVFYAEINWDLILAQVPVKPMTFKGLAKFPGVRRDLALIVDQTVSFQQIENAAFRAERKLLRNVGLFDVYEGEKVPSGKKSYALSFILQDEEKTLTDQDIEKAMTRILRSLTTEFNAVLR